MKPTHRAHAFPNEPKTLVGYAPPLHLPAGVLTGSEDEYRERAIAYGLATDDTIVVDVEIAPDGQYIERMP